MIGSGINFDIEGTTWWKPDGSDHFKVQSVFFDGSGMTIQTNDGRMISGERLTDYIQSETPIKPKQETPKINKALLMQGLDNPDELGDVFITDTPKVGENLAAPERKQEVKQESTNDIIIRRMLDNLGNPEYDFKFDMNCSPEYVSKLKQSAEIMGIRIEDVRNYIYRNMDKDQLIQKIQDGFNKSFNSLFDIKDLMDDIPDDMDELLEKPIEKPKKTKKSK